MNELTASLALFIWNAVAGIRQTHDTDKKDFQHLRRRVKRDFKTLNNQPLENGTPVPEGKKGLQRPAFLLDCGPMRVHKSVTNLLVAATFCLCSLSAQAIEQPPKFSDEPSLFERYTNSAQDLVLKGLELVGINYRRGGTSPDSGLDCSGFVQVVFRESIGKLLPRTAKEQSQVGNVVDKSDLKPGDLVFFNTMRRAFSHVGIYLGDNRFMHAPRTGAEVRVEDMSQSYWVKRYNGARRVIER